MSALRKTCLIVDDSRAIRAVARQLLEELGFDAREAANGLEAIASCREQMPDMILLDRNMPQLDGIGCVRAIRALPGGKEPKVIFCTTESSLMAIAEAIAAGADEYIMKPFDREILELKLSMVGI
ncbi:MAG: response regulator [Rhodospirillales bacterium]|nr:response regulator [Rhodospirillales bacterium]